MPHCNNAILNSIYNPRIMPASIVSGLVMGATSTRVSRGLQAGAPEALLRFIISSNAMNESKLDAEMDVLSNEVWRYTPDDWKSDCKHGDACVPGLHAWAPCICSHDS